MNRFTGIHPSQKFIVPVFLLVILLMSCRSGHDSNYRNELDSLEKLIESDTSGNFNRYFETALNIAVQHQDTAGMAAAYRAIGNYYQNEGAFETADSLYRIGLQLADKAHVQAQQIVTRVSLARNLGSENKQSKADSVFGAIRKMLPGLTDSSAIASGWEETALYETNKGNYDEALRLLNIVIPIYGKLRDSSALAASYNNAGIAYYKKGAYLDAIRFYQAALPIMEKNGDPEEVKRIKLNIGILYKESGYYDLALDWLLKAAVQFEEAGMKRELASAYNTIGNVHLQMKNYDLAIRYHEQALSMRHKIGNVSGEAGSYTNIGETYMTMGKPAEAKTNLLESIRIKKSLPDTTVLGSSYNLMGELLLRENKLNEAQTYFRKALHFYQDDNHRREKTQNQYQLARLFRLQGQTDSAKHYASLAESSAAQNQFRDILLKVYSESREIAAAQKDWEKALDYSARQLSLSDSLFGEQKNKALAEMQIKYESSRQAQTIELLSARNKSHEATVAKQTYLITSLIAGAGILVLIFLYIYRTQQNARMKSQQQLRHEQMTAKHQKTMLHELHHRVKNNLQVLSSLLDLQLLQVKDNESRDALQAVERRLRAMLLIHRGLYGETASGNIDMKPYTQELIRNLRQSYGLPENKLRITEDIEPVMLDGSMALNTGILLNEIISNAMKHAVEDNPDPEIILQMKNSNGEIILEISDNGRGFDTSQAQNQSSFGMKLIYLLVKQIRGSIRISSDSNGTHYRITYFPNTQPQ